MAVVIALVIAGWLVAFALGAQAGFDNEPTVAEPTLITESAVEPVRTVSVS
ncbi:hypothetical protein [cf. Phormidesmis sp. LEGE 11477]|uniref:hypothetical protein n=1 Tax=cf. Phormidesmis sp. LEGE 11477 TaxID=1828680 RepID=UPI0018821B8B|nr:hypothetical protein [cf. Phormidesmis sp. LEGE 11477]MBE9060561.1 hypothetical protein [cf. Phormidesmis sp. LEGE 11477]